MVVGVEFRAQGTSLTPLVVAARLGSASTVGGVAASITLLGCTGTQVMVLALQVH